MAHGKTNAEGEVPSYLRHGSEKHQHRFPGCLIVSSDNKAALLRMTSSKEGRDHPTPFRYFPRSLSEMVGGRYPGDRDRRRL